MAVEEVAAQLLGYGCDLVEVTGGEPLLQAAVHPLIARLLEAGMHGAGGNFGRAAT